MATEDELLDGHQLVSIREQGFALEVETGMQSRPGGAAFRVKLRKRTRAAFTLRKRLRYE